MRLRADAEIGEDLRDRDRMGDVRLAALALLPVVRPLGGRVRALDQRDVGLRMVRPTVRISVSTAPGGCEREKSRGTRRRSDAVVGGCSRVSVTSALRVRSR